MNREKRNHPRTAVDWPVVVQYALGGSVAELENISAGGAFIRLDRPLMLDREFKLHIATPNRGTLSVVARVVWLNVDCSLADVPACGIGIQFTDVTPFDQHVLRSEGIL